FSVWGISATLDIPADQIEDLCEGLAEKELFIQFAGIEETCDEGLSAHYEFRHSLYRQVVYQKLSEVSRSKLHRLLGERLKLLCTSGRQEVAAELAMHFELGHEFEQAIHYLVIAAENAGKRFAYRDSIEILQHALALVQKVDSLRLIETELRILQLIGDTHYWLGEISQSAQAYERQSSRAAQAGLEAAQLNAMERLVLPYGFIDPDHGIRVSEQAVQLSTKLNDPVLLALSQMLCAGYRCVYETWRDEDWEVWTSANETFCRLSVSPLPLNHYHLYLYLLLLRGEYQETLKLLEAEPSLPMSDTANLMLYVFRTSAHTVVLLRSGRLGELLQLVRDGQELAA